jgi:tol-pal system protein YbgF
MKQVNPSFKITTVALAAVVSSSLLVSTALHAEDLDKRVQRLEQIVDNRQQLDLVNQVTQMQQTVEALRGEMDVQARSLQELTERQQLYFQDMDQRLAALEEAKGNPSSVSPIEPLYPSVPTTPATNSVPAANTSPTTTQTPISAAATATDPADPVTPSANTAPVETPTVTEVAANPAPVASTPLQDQAAYQQAYQQVLNKNYPQAITDLNNYLRDYPQGAYRANAYYWLGEVYLIDNQPQQAQHAFNTVLNDYPQNSKAGDALLKLGYAHAALGDNAQAKTVLNQVMQQYPNTQLARLAETRLAELVPAP